MKPSIQHWYDFLLQQMVAECYLEGMLDFLPSDDLRRLLDNGNNRNPDLGSGLTRFSRIQSDEFLVRFKIVNQWSDNPNRSGNISPEEPGFLELNGEQILANTGFSATLIKNIDPDSPDFEKLTISIRSSEYATVADGGDRSRDIFGTDKNAIFGFGLALAQLDSLERYVEWLHAEGLIADGEKINITGYSLGGHLATLFAELHPEQVLHAYTFNGAGRGEWNHDKGGLDDILAFYRSVLADPSVAFDLVEGSGGLALYLGAKLDDDVHPVSIFESSRYIWAMEATRLKFDLRGTGAMFPLGDPDRTGLKNGAEDLISQIYGHAATGDAEYATNSGIHGPATEVFIEGQPRVQGLFPGGEQFDYATSHSLTLLADSLAVARLFEKLDPALDIGKLGKIFSAASAQKATFVGNIAEGDSLERIVETLGKILGIELLPMKFDRSASGFADLTNRNVFHENLSRISSNLPPGAVQITSVLDLTAEQLASRAKQDYGIAYRYSLRNLIPFVLQDLGGSLYEKFTEGHPRHGELEMSEQWINDRADMLAALVIAHRNDRESHHSGLIGPTGPRMYIAQDLDGDPLTIRPFDEPEIEFAQTVFGGDLAENMQGTSFEDHLYGGAGNDDIYGLNGGDWLEGGRGEDRIFGGLGNDKIRGDAGDDRLFGEGGIDKLEGMAGNDLLEGGTEDDILIGGEGDDSLDGGSGNDILDGGADFDTYSIRSGQGVDTIVDSDGSGKIFIDGIALMSPEGGFRKVNDVWLGESNAPYFMQFDGNPASGGTLVIAGQFDGQVRIENFRNGDFGIHLSGEIFDVWDWQPLPDATWEADSRVNVGTMGRDSVSAVGDHSVFFGMSGDDVLGQVGNPSSGHVDFFGGAGNDVLVAGQGGSTLIGGAGQDVILGSTGADSLIGEGFAGFLTEHFSLYDFYYKWDSGTEGDYGSVVYNGRWNWNEGNPFHFDSDIEEAMRWVLGLNGDEDLSVYYNDYLNGGSGNDGLKGMAGSDELFGGAGNDYIEGDSEVLTIESGVDYGYLRALLGNFGNDYLDGGEGNDTLMDKVAGSDVFLGGTGNDILINEERNHQAPDNIRYLADSLTGREIFNNYLDGGDGNDQIKTTNSYVGSRDEIKGGTGNDLIEAYGIGVRFLIDGGEGDDVMKMSAGEFVVTGGGGNDAYELPFEWVGPWVVSEEVVVSELTRKFEISNVGANEGDQDTLAITLLAPVGSVGWFRIGKDLVMSLGEREDWITIENWFVGTEWKMDRIMINSMESSVFQFTENEWTTLQIERMAIWKGTSASDLMVGTDNGQQIRGEEGDDVIIGGTGDDVFRGGTGHDTYRFGSQSGNDVIEKDGDLSGIDVVEISEDVFQSNLALQKVGDDLVLQIASTGDTLTIREWFSSESPAVDRIQFANGQFWDRAAIASITQSNHVPFTTDVIPDQEATEGLEFLYLIPEGLFRDIDPGDSLRYAFTLENGESLPDWLFVDAESGTLSGIPNSGASEALRLRLTATDRYGASAFLSFNIEIVDLNNVPLLVAPIGPQSAVDSIPFEFFVPEGTFLDADPGDVLTYAVAMSGAAGLPGWLHFDPVSRRFSGTPADMDIGEVFITVSVMDLSGASASSDMTLAVKRYPDLQLTGRAGSQQLTGKSGNDVLDGGAGADQMAGMGGDDTYYVDNQKDVVVETPSQGIDLVSSSVNYVLPDNVENLMLTGAASSGTGNSMNNWLVGNTRRSILKGMSGDDILDGGAKNDALYGGDGNDVVTGRLGNDDLYGDVGDDYLTGGGGQDYLVGGSGVDYLSGGDGNDDIVDESGRGVLDGGAGNDSLAGGSDRGFFAGGIGNDQITTGAGPNVLAFNQGDGKDTIKASSGSENTLSLGQGISISDLHLTKRGRDLVLAAGAGDQITFKDWYLRPEFKSVTRLQLVSETVTEPIPDGQPSLLVPRIDVFDFHHAVAAFDAARQVSGWSMTEALLSAHLAESETDAIGGELAYEYGTTGSLHNMDLASVRNVLGTEEFGKSLQRIGPNAETSLA